MSLTFFAGLSGLGLGLAGEDDEAQGPGEDEDVGDVVEQGIVPVSYKNLTLPTSDLV